MASATPINPPTNNNVTTSSPNTTGTAATGNAATVKTTTEATATASSTTPTAAAAAAVVVPVVGGSTAAPSSGGPAPFHTASLYVGDIHPEVTEALLFEIFNAVGPVASIRVCRDAVTRRSLGYAYVNFHNVSDAERALDTMNYTTIKSVPCRIMWSQRDPSLRKSGLGNIFIKNLDQSLDNKALYDTFSLFGNILSCKVVNDGTGGSSKGYGYVHYETAEAAEEAIDKINGMLVAGSEVYVGQFQKRQERPDEANWTNCYVKNIPKHWTEADLRKEFQPFGSISSCVVMKGASKGNTVDSMMEKMDLNNPAAAAATTDKEEGVTATETTTETEVKTAQEMIDSRGFGFVNYEDPEAAQGASENLNGKIFKSLDGSDVELFVGKAQKKTERERELRTKFETMKIERINKYQGVNLYVKNLDDQVTDDELREAFAPHGTITSSRVMRDTTLGTSRGFGFVCFSTPEEATKAVTEMNGKLLNAKPMYVALAQRKEVRRAQLEAQHAQQRAVGGNNGMNGMPGVNGIRGGMPMGVNGQPGNNGQPGGPMFGAAPMFYAQPNQMPGNNGRQNFMYPQQMMRGGQQGGQVPRGVPHMPYGGRGNQGGPVNVGGYQMPPPGAYGMPQNMQQQQQSRQGGNGGRGNNGGRRPNNNPGQGGRGGHHQGGNGQMNGQGANNAQNNRNFKYTANARNHPIRDGQHMPPPGPHNMQQGQQQQPPHPGQQMQQNNQQQMQQHQMQMQQQMQHQNHAGQQAQVQQMQQQAQTAQTTPVVEPLTSAVLVNASEEQQKNMIGERLYPLIHQEQPNLAGKITGMLLEMDNGELLVLLESREALTAKITEAIQVLEAHQTDVTEAVSAE